MIIQVMYYIMGISYMYMGYWFLNFSLFWGGVWEQGTYIVRDTQVSGYLGKH